jgi:hypothetical protein
MLSGPDSTLPYVTGMTSEMQLGFGRRSHGHLPLHLGTCYPLPCMTDAKLDGAGQVNTNRCTEPPYTEDCRVATADSLLVSLGRNFCPNGDAFSTYSSNRPKP